MGNEDCVTYCPEFAYGHQFDACISGEYYYAMNSSDGECTAFPSECVTLFSFWLGEEA